MNRKEFDSYFRPMCKALDVAVNHFQADYFFEDFKLTDVGDWKAACAFEAQGPAKKLPYQDHFHAAVIAAKEMRQEQERLDREKNMGQVHRVDFTPQERLEANRGAYEGLRQARECRSTGRNCWSPIKVREACLDSSKDEEIRAKYGDEGPGPALVFGGSFLTA